LSDVNIITFKIEIVFAQNIIREKSPTSLVPNLEYGFKSGVTIQFNSLSTASCTLRDSQKSKCSKSIAAEVLKQSDCNIFLFLLENYHE
jgi:hypothetical protein